LSAVLLVAPSAPALAADEVGLVDSSQGQWFLRDQAGGTASFYYGNPGDVPLMGDWDCDGVDTPAMYRPSTGFMYLRNSNSQGFADLDYFYGNPSDLPLAGDFDGDGCDTLAIYRPSEGRVYVKDSLGTGVADYSYYFGNPGDKPFTGDFDGDGTDTVGLHRESTGFVYLRNSHTQGFADLAFYYGDPGDRLVAGDWIAQQTDTVGVFRPAESRFYLRYSNSQGFADESFLYGQGSWLPVAGTFGEIRAIPDLTLQTVATGLSAPVFLTSPPGDPRLFVVEQPGGIKIVQGGSVSTFLDITGKVAFGGERGLLGLAFHPGYSSNGRFFVHYTRQSDGDVVVEEYRVSADPNRAEGSAVKAWLVAEHSQFSNHNGGMLEFGPDGWLYAAVGDGGGGGDPLENGQNPNTPLGTITRIDVDGAGGTQMWAYGLRNPWRFSFDPPGGLIYIGDAGQNAWEENDVAPISTQGINYGWDVMEGKHCFEPPSGCDPSGLTLPVLEYANPAQGDAVIGGFVYRGSAIAGLPGSYLYGDLRGWVRSFRYENGAVTDEREWFPDVGSLFSFGRDSSGELYLLTSDGQVRKIVPVGS
jgi:glucose/arabinose dehydrogenase